MPLVFRLHTSPSHTHMIMIVKTQVRISDQTLISSTATPEYALSDADFHEPLGVQIDVQNNDDDTVTPLFIYFRVRVDEFCLISLVWDWQSPGFTSAKLYTMKNSVYPSNWNVWEFYTPKTPTCIGSTMKGLISPWDNFWVLTVSTKKDLYG